MTQTAPDLTGRTARCTYGDKTAPSDPALAFFTYLGPGSADYKASLCKTCGYAKQAHNPKYMGHLSVVEDGRCVTGYIDAGPKAEDEFYCGCLGWD